MNLTQEDWISQLTKDENAIILDVRTQDECNEGIIPNALVNLDIYEGQEFIDKLEKLDKSKNYYVYCRSGVRSAKACDAMNNLGFKNTFNLLGGFLEWDGKVVSPED
jgi:rhodanese-related sulfurtransferase